MSDEVKKRYENAQNIMQGVLTSQLIKNDAVFPHWIPGSECFWYCRELSAGKEYRIVDAEMSKNYIAFDHKKFASALSVITGKPVDEGRLPIKNVSISLFPTMVRFNALSRYWTYYPENNEIREAELSKGGLQSPDGESEVFVKEYNLWVRDCVSGRERPLTEDGSESCGYGRLQVSSVGNIVHAVWSPNSNQLLTVRLDIRGVSSRPLICYSVTGSEVTPNVKNTTMSYPGDEVVEACEIVVINIKTGGLQKAKYPSLPLSGYGRGYFSSKLLGWWSLDSRYLFFVDLDRGAKVARVVELDSHTGITRVLFEESADTFLKLCHTTEDIPLFVPIPENDELIWFSERSGWGHLYLYDLVSGKLKHTVTEGQWIVREVLHFDQQKREILIQTSGRNIDISPYYCDVCKINIDSRELTPLVSGEFECTIYQPHSYSVLNRGLFNIDSGGVRGVSPSGAYVVATCSRVDTIPESILIDRDGTQLLSIESADVSGLPEDWIWPEPIKSTAADRKTQINGVLYRPPGFSEEKKYPVLDFVCSTRNFSTVPQGAFINGPCIDYPYLSAAAYAALGFIVVVLEGRGTPRRNKLFQDHRYGDSSGTCDLEDHIACIKSLAKDYKYMDLDRVGITGMDGLSHTIYGLLDYPDFYSVLVLHCFTDPRLGYSAWGESYDGIPPIEGTMNTPERKLEDSIDSLQGKVLIVDGMLNFMAPTSTFRLIDALQRANKDFDMLIFPNEGHTISTYALRRSWDYLVTHLMGEKPPHQFELKTSIDWLMEEWLENIS